MTARPSGAFCPGSMRHRHHADDHGERRHQHRPEARDAGLERGLDALLPSASCSRAKLTTRMLFAVATPMHMIAPVSAGTDNVVPVTNNIQTMPARAAGQRRDDDERVEPGLEVDDDQQIDQHDREGQADHELLIGARHGRHLAPDRDRRPLRKLAERVVDDFLDVRGDAAEIPILCRSIDIHNVADVILRNDRIERLGRKGCKTAKELLRVGGLERQVLEIPKGVDAVLRGLDGHGVGDAVSGAQPVGRRRLGAARQGRLKARGGVVLGESHDAGKFAVEVDPEGGVLEGLLDARVGDPGNMADLRQELGCEGAAGLEIIACDLDVDRRGRPEIEDLAHHIRRKERERGARKRPRELLAQRLHVIVGRGCSFAQGHENVVVEDADRARVAVREVDAADGQADVIDDARQPVRRDDGADLLIDLVGQHVVSSIRVPVGARM